MLARLVRAIVGTTNERALKKHRARIGAINSFEAGVKDLSDEDLAGKTAEFRKRLEAGEKLDDILPEAFSVVREAARRTLGLRHFDVQMLGGQVLHAGGIAEMRTGEGKTLVATLPAYLNALPGKGVHVVTVNDYLARRDAETMGRIYRFLGLSVGVIVHGMSDAERKAAYDCDITYGTNNEFGFDYLRDNMKFRADEKVQRDFHYAIVDEVDSILIDEARTPLIISGPTEETTELYIRIDGIVAGLIYEDGVYEKDEKQRTSVFTEAGNERLEVALRDAGLLTQGGLYDPENVALVHHAAQSLKAHTLFKLDVHYVVRDGKVVIVDEFTGRMMDGRRFGEGLHQAIEAKEKVEVQPENQTLASITYQNFFRLYPRLAGMTGTAATEADEFIEIYNLGVVEIPTNKPVARKDEDDKVYRSAGEKLDAIIQTILEAQKKGQPVLVGTASIEKSEIVSARLSAQGIPHQVLNARHHEREAEIIAQAGRSGAVTIATNMAGRGTDIQLGGNAEMMARAEVGVSEGESYEEALRRCESDVRADRERVRAAGGLFVIGTERNESRRIDNQLRGRSGRQGDPGHTIFYLSLEDDLMRIFGSDRMGSLLEKVGLQKGEAIVHSWVTRALEKAQKKVEARNFDIRKNILKYDNVMNDQRREVYSLRREILAASGSPTGASTDERLDVAAAVASMRQETVEAIVAKAIPEHAYPEQWDLEGLSRDVNRIFGLDLPVTEWAREEGIDDTQVRERIYAAANEAYQSRVSFLGEQAVGDIERGALLYVLDQAWKDHLLALDYLRQGIGLRAYGQRDPLNEYKTEAFSLFNAMLTEVRERVTQTLMGVQVHIRTEPLPGASPDLMAGDAFLPPPDPSLSGQAWQGHQDGEGEGFRFPRNAPCLCGSGLRYKHCHGRLQASPVGAPAVPLA